MARARRLALALVLGAWQLAAGRVVVAQEPENALIDRNGRIVFKPQVHDSASRAVLERQVEALLECR